MDRTILAKAILSNTPTHVMQTIMLPETINQKINKIQWQFVWWSSSTEKNKIHLLNWTTLTSNKDIGGLSLQDAKVKNKALITKLAWTCSTNQHKLWASILINKYTEDRTFHRKNLMQISSRTWKYLLQGWEIWLKNLFWVLGNSVNTSLWNDQWIPSMDPYDRVFRVLYLKKRKRK